jgi:hypothetical protein
MNPPAIINIIHRIEAKKRAANIVPSYALFLEVAREYGNAVQAREELDKLCREGVIETGRTLNDQYIRLVDKK